MKSIHHLFYLVAILFIISCGNKKNENITTISGQFSNTLGETILFEELTVNELITLDSTKVDEDGKFEMELEIPEPTFVLIKAGKQNFTTLLLEPNEEVKVEADIRQIGKTYTVKNSAGSELLWQIEHESNKVRNQFDSLYEYWMQHRYDSNNYEIQLRLDSVSNKILKEHKEFRKELIDNNTNSFACIIALYQRIGERNLFTFEADIDYFEKVANALNASYPENEHVIDLVTRVNDFKERKKNREITEQNLQPGKPAPEISSLTNKNGKPVSLENFKGKTVLLYFWNTRNRLNREENMELVKLYRKYQPKGFEIISIAVDEKMELWLSAVEIDRLKWTNCMTNDEIKKLYNIEDAPNFEPRSFLLNKEGIIQAKDFRVAELDKLLQDLVN